MASSGEREMSFCDKKLSGNISRALYTQKGTSLFCDIIMRICGTEMAAHSAVLAAASPYFCSFLSQDLPRQFSQKSPQIIEIQIDGSATNESYAEAVTTVIDFIYTGVLQLKTNSAVQVSEIARIMQLDEVIAFCEEFLLDQNKVNSEPSGVTEDIKTIDRGMNTEADNSIYTLPGHHRLGTNQLRSRAGLVMPVGGRPLVVQPVSVGPQKLFKAGKLVSTSTQVTPTLLGILPPAPKETRDCKTQTLDKDFPDKIKTYARGRRKLAVKQQIVDINDKCDGSEIVMEITKTKQAPASVRVVRQKSVEESPEEVHIHVDEEGKMKITDTNCVDLEGNLDPFYDAENEFSEIFFDSSARRRSCRKPKPTPKIIALRRKGVPLTIKQETTLEEPDPGEVVNIDRDVMQRKSPRKTKLVPREEGPTENIAEEMETEKEKEPEEPLATEEGAQENQEPMTEEKEMVDEQGEAESKPMPDNIQNVPHITSVSPRRKSVVRLRRRRRPFKKFTCSECSFQTNKVREFTCHKRLHKMESNICYYCEEQYVSKEDLNEHFEKHKGPLPYFCPICDVRYKSKTQLNIHLPKHSKDKPFVCEVCSAGFKWKHALKNHMIVHSNRKDHLCDQCGYATAHKCQLKAHKLIHSGETFRCPFPECRFQATKRQNLKYHLLTHTREKPHQCEICGQSFSLIKNMRRHMLLHNKVKPYHCDQCDFSTTRFDKLKEHMLKLHGMGSPPEKRVRVADLVKDYNGLGGSVIVPQSEEALLNDTPLAEDEGVVAPLGTAAGNSIPVITDDLIQGTVSSGMLEQQTVQFVPGQTIIITHTGQDGEVQTHEVTMPTGTSLLEASQTEQVQNTMQFAEIMIPANQLPDYVQEFTFVPQT